MHKQARNYVERLKAKFPEYFKGKKVLEIGSLNINGSVRDLFEDCDYFGVDMVEGEGVDWVGSLLDYVYSDHEGSDDTYDVVFSTEALEHDENWEGTFFEMFVESYQFLFFTCATTGREEHGTSASKPQDSPATNDYYRNLTEADFREAFNLDEMFSSYEFEVNEESHDLYFWGIANYNLVNV